MPEYLSPGVYVEEVDAGPKPIAPVATSTAGAVGVTQRGPTTPTLITSYADFVRRFGGPMPIPDEATRTQWANRGHWWHAAESVKAFFDEGGARVYFQRVWSGAAVAASADFNGGLQAIIETDIEPTSTTVRVSHTVGVAPGAFDVVSDDGSTLGSVNATAVNHGTRTLTIGAAGFSARSGRDRLVIRPLAAPALDILTAEAANRGVWGNDVRVRALPTVGARLLLAAPAGGAPVSTQTTAAAAANANTIEVAPVAGALDQNTPTPFRARLNGGAPVDVTGVALAGAGPNLTLTLGTPLAAALPAGSTVDLLRPALNPPTVLGATQTTAAANAGDGTIEVAPAPGVLAQNTPTPVTVRIAGGAPVDVTAIAVAGAGPNLTLTLGTPVAANVAVGGAVEVVQPSAAITVMGAARLYAGALVQLEGAGGAEIGAVDSVAGTAVTLAAPPANDYTEGDALTLLEAAVEVSYRPPAGSEETERFVGRLTDPPDPMSIVEVVNLGSQLIRLAAGADWDGDDLDRFPSTAAAWAVLENGDDALLSLGVRDFVGENLGPGQRTGIQALEEIDQVAIALVPGMWADVVNAALIVHCETLGDRFAIIDSPPGLGVQEIEAFRSPIDTKYAALYYPWVAIMDPRPGPERRLELPPSGFVAGIYARTDVARGVHKAPANETLRSILLRDGLAQRITKREQDILNPQNINVLRFFPGRGNRVWGARVLTSDPAWRYVSVRRLFLMIYESIDEGTQWVVFEPNDEPLWARVRQTVTRFLFTQWRLGALQGATADEAFFVTCDRSTMTQDDIDNGRLIAVVGIAPVKPAEFVIFRIQQKTLELTTV